MATVVCGSIRFSETRLEEVDGPQIMVAIPRGDISSIRVCYGESVEKPITQVVIGILLAVSGFALGVWPLLGYLSSLPSDANGRMPHFLPVVSAATLIIFGISLIFPAFRKSYYLQVETTSGTRKLTVKGCSPGEVVSACRDAGFRVLQ